MSLVSLVSSLGQVRFDGKVVFSISKVSVSQAFWQVVFLGSCQCSGSL